MKKAQARTRQLLKGDQLGQVQAEGVGLLSWRQPAPTHSSGSSGDELWVSLCERRPHHTIPTVPMRMGR